MLERTIPLVKPGGWLIIEELLPILWESDVDKELDPLLAAWINAWDKMMEARELDARAAIKHESLLRESGVFSEIKVDKLYLPISEQTGGEYGSPLYTHLHRLMRHPRSSFQ